MIHGAHLLVSGGCSDYDPPMRRGTVPSVSVTASAELATPYQHDRLYRTRLIGGDRLLKFSSEGFPEFIDVIDYTREEDKVTDDLWT